MQTANADEKAAREALTAAQLVVDTPATPTPTQPLVSPRATSAPAISPRKPVPMPAARRMPARTPSARYVCVDVSL